MGAGRRQVLAHVRSNNVHLVDCCSVLLRDVFMTKREMITAADCLKCGACCISLQDQHVYCDVTPDDQKRLGKRFVRLNVVQFSSFDHLAATIDGRAIPYGAIRTEWHEAKTGPFRGISFCQCAALRGSVMQHTSCSVYTRRPKACREAVKPGDRNCRELRRLLQDAIERELA